MAPATMEDVAREAGVSRALVSMVFRGVAGVSESRRDAVLAAAERLDYSPNRLASLLASTRTNTIGLLIADMHNSVFADVTDGILEVMDETPYQLVLATSGGSVAREVAAMQRLVDLRVDAIMTIGSQMPSADLLRFARRLPTMLLTREVETVDSVDSDNVRGATMATEYVLGLGHRRVAFIGSPSGSAYDARYRGYAAAMEAAGLPLLAADDGGFHDHMAGGTAAAHRLLSMEDRPTAIVCFNDVLALGAIDAAVELGLDVPGDVSIVGYDDTSVARLSWIGLTTVALHAKEIGRVATTQVVDRLRDGELSTTNRRIAPALVVRETTAAPRI